MSFFPIQFSPMFPNLTNLCVCEIRYDKTENGSMKFITQDHELNKENVYIPPRYHVEKLNTPKEVCGMIARLLYCIHVTKVCRED